MQQIQTNLWDAEDYAKNSSVQQQWAQELIAKLELRGNEAVLDIGCGDGKITYEIARHLPSGTVTGFDASEKMIATAQKYYQKENLSFSQMDAVNFQYNRKFDVAFSNAVLHWVRDIPDVLHNLKHHLNPMARILFQMGGAGNAKDMIETIESIMASETWHGYFQEFQFPYNFCSIEDYKGWLSDAGYKIKRIELIPKDMMHENREGLKGWLRTTWFPYTERIPEAEREAFLNRCLDDYLAVYPVDVKGRTHVRMMRLEVEAAIC